MLFLNAVVSLRENICSLSPLSVLARNHPFNFNNSQKTASATLKTSLICQFEDGHQQMTNELSIA